MTHTPGPWSWDGSDWPFVINDAQDRVIAVIPDPYDQIDPTLRVTEQAAEANARLIAAAPELLALVESCAYCHDGGDSFDLAERDAWMRDARALLARLDSAS